LDRGPQRSGAICVRDRSNHPTSRRVARTTCVDSVALRNGLEGVPSSLNERAPSYAGVQLRTGRTRNHPLTAVPKPAIPVRPTSERPAPDVASVAWFEWHPRKSQRTFGRWSSAPRIEGDAIPRRSVLTGSQ
jgi:hypothetical protein